MDTQSIAVEASPDVEVPSTSISKSVQEPVLGAISNTPQERWNYPRMNKYRTFSACFSFIIMGVNDAAYGALIPYFETYYDINYTVVSVIFIAPVVGYALSALLTNRIHKVFGQRGIALLGPGAHLLDYIILSVHPPYPVVVIAAIIGGFGNGILDGAWNAWIGNMQHANELLGFLHGAYGLGGVFGPLVSTAMITRASLEWYYFYYLMVGLSAAELLFAAVTFWERTGKQFRDEHSKSNGNVNGNTKEAMKSRIVWICSIFLLIYVGIEVSIGGWIVTFEMEVRHATPFDAGMSATGFWLGITLGRVVLGFVTGKIGEKLAILIYLGLVLALHLILYLVPSLPVSYVAVALEGFFLAPLFPAAVVAATKLLPPHLHVSGIAFAAALGAVGACVWPFAVGAIAQSKGVQVLMPILLALVAADAAVWALLPGLKREKKVEVEDHVEKS